MRRKLINVIGFRNDGRVIVDCSDVPLISSSFADEVFGKLFVELGPMKFLGTVQFRHLDPLVSDLIDRAVMQRMNQ